MNEDGLSGFRFPDALTGDPSTSWKDHTQRGNDAFNGKDYDGAGKHYERAWQEARTRFTTARAGFPEEQLADVVPMVVVSAANMADNWARRGDHGRAEATNRAALDLICDAIRDRATPKDMRGVCLMHLHRALLELVERLNGREGNEDAIAEVVAAAKEVALAGFAEFRDDN